jgi:CheY-like chemotaxis protein
MRILIVDDCPVARMGLRDMLENEGFTVTEAENGECVVTAVDRVDADLILCDMLMPGCNGLDVIRELRRRLPHVKIVAMSGGRYNGTADMLQTAMYLGADEILYKPFSSAKLMAIIRQVMVRLAVS